MEELRESVTDNIPRGGGRKGVRQLFQGGGTGGVAFWGRDMATYPEDGEGPGYITARGRAPAHRETTVEKGDRC